MDISGISMALSQNKALNDVGMAVMARSLDDLKTSGENMVQMIDSAAMERSVNPAVGGNIDLMV